MYCIISPFSKTFDEIWIIYFIPEFLRWEIKTWQIIEIPIKSKIEIWVLLKIIKNENDLNLWFDKNKIKSIIWIKNNNDFLPTYQKELITWISKYYFSSIHNSLKLFFPTNLRQKILKNKIDLNNKNILNYNYEKDIKLTNNQNEILNEILKNKNQKILLFWITWSWKTEIYIKLIKNYIEKNKQVLLLIPEIVLTNQIAEKIINIFWKEVIILNSSVSEAKKTKYWIDIYNNNAKIIIWTRSSIFYPFIDLWLIIIDEEHDNSYISDSQPRYNCIEVAEQITKLNWNKLILASWTPSIKSMYKWVNWEYKILNLFEKYKK